MDVEAISVHITSCPSCPNMVSPFDGSFNQTTKLFWLPAGCCVSLLLCVCVCVLCVLCEDVCELIWSPWVSEIG